jgi:chemotaxis signal transduction protein
VIVLVRAETAVGAWAVPVAATRGVVEPGTLRPRPSPAPGVLGLLDHQDEALPVLAAAGETGRHVLVLDAAGTRFGLLVERVTGVVRLAEAEVDPPPAGQAEPLVTGVVRRPGAEALVLAPEVLARRVPAQPGSTVA